jgi:hypothetical protein
MARPGFLPAAAAAGQGRGTPAGGQPPPLPIPCCRLLRRRHAGVGDADRHGRTRGGAGRRFARAAVREACASGEDGFVLVHGGRTNSCLASLPMGILLALVRGERPAPLTCRTSVGLDTRPTGRTSSASPSPPATLHIRVQQLTDISRAQCREDNGVRKDAHSVCGRPMRVLLTLEQTRALAHEPRRKFGGEYGELEKQCTNFASISLPQF